MDISEKNETKVMHWITFKVSSTVNVTSVAMTTVTYQNGKEITLNPIYFANEFCDPMFFYIKTFFIFK